MSEKTRIELISRPRSPRRQHQVVLDEVEVALNKLADDIAAGMERLISDWEHIPDFIGFAIANKDQWTLQVGYNEGTHEADIFGWVDKGTGKWGPKGEEYPIVPVNADVLAFTMPTPTKTVPPSGLSGLSGIGIVVQDVLGGSQEVRVKGVMHPGIEPRNFTGRIREIYNNPTMPGGFRSTIEAAVKRAYRKIGKGAS